MKITAEQAAIATLDLVMAMSAKQNLFNRFLVYSLSQSNEEAVQALEGLNQVFDRELDLIRAKVFQYASIDPNDLLNGNFDI